MGQQDILGLDVAVHDAHAMGVGQRVGHGSGERQDFGRQQATSSGAELPQRPPVNVGRDIIKEAPELPRVVQGENMGVGQAGGRLDLPQKPLGAELGGEPREQHFDRDVAVMLGIASQVDRRHAAPPQHALQLVPPGEGGLEVGRDVGSHGARI